MNYVKGDLIKLAFKQEFDVITHGCNCWCTMGSGIAVQMAKFFGCHTFPKEMYVMDETLRGDYNKLGTIDYKTFYVGDDGNLWTSELIDNTKELVVVNSYTQFSPGVATPPYDIPLDYDALRMCFRKINYQFKGRHLGIPLIGSALAKGDWNKIEKIIKEETPDMEVTVVEYER